MKRILLIIFLLLHFNVMADDNFPKFFYDKVVEVQSTYPKGSFERMVDPSLVTTLSLIHI